MQYFLPQKSAMAGSLSLGFRPFLCGFVLCSAENLKIEKSLALETLRGCNSPHTLKRLEGPRYGPHPLSDDERTGLEASIKAEGCREAIIVWDGTIVDGHNRYEICTRLGIEFQAHEKFFPNADAVIEWIIKNQFGRRNLSLMDRSRLALRLEGVYQERAKANQATSTGGPHPQLHQKSDKAAPVNTLKEIAKVAGVRENIAMHINNPRSSCSYSNGPVCSLLFWRGRLRIATLRP